MNMEYATFCVNRSKKVKNVVLNWKLVANFGLLKIQKYIYSFTQLISKKKFFSFQDAILFVAY
jgi:hypothetical protein